MFKLRKSVNQFFRSYRIIGGAPVLQDVAITFPETSLPPMYSINTKDHVLNN